MGCRLLCLLFALAGCDKILDLREVPGTDAGPVVDAYIPVQGCSPTSLIDEEFDEPGSLRWFPVIVATAPEDMPTTSGGVLHVNMAVDGYLTVATERYYDLRDDRITLEMEVTGTDPTNSLSINLHPATALDGGEYLQLLHDGTDIVAYRFDNSVPIELWRAPYDPAQHRFLRFENRANATTISTSATGVDTEFVVHATVSDGPWIGFVKLDVFMHATGTTPLVAELYSVHGGTSPVGACAARELRDDFEGATLDARWARTQAYGGALVQQNGAIEMSYIADGMTNANVALTPATVYDLRGDSIAIEIPDMVDTATYQMFQFSVVTLTGAFVDFQQRMGMLVATRSNTIVGSTTYDAVSHRWWRFREAAGTLYWETSPDGVTYQTFASTTDVTGLDVVDVFASLHGMADTPRTARVTNFNTP